MGQLNILKPTPENVQAAAKSLRDGRLVIMPTETVYGLAASIWREDALTRIFQVKRRPSDNPLIVHIAERESLDELVTEVTSSAQALAEAFWPGPLTLVLRKSSTVSDIVTAGGGTVAVRLPSHPVALKLISAAKVPIAAPSANRFMALSPTEAQHVEFEIAAEAEYLLDGGPCSIGIESTVVDCTGELPRILRPGILGLEDLSQVVPMISDSDINVVRRSPGQYVRHYSPTTPLRIVDYLREGQAGITTVDAATGDQIRLPSDPKGYAAGLYAALHKLDSLGFDEILVQAPPETAEWSAVWDRSRKAQG